MSACSGVSLPRSVVTGIVGQVLTPTLGQVQTTLAALTFGTVNLGLSSALTTAASGAPIGLNAVDIDGNAIDVATVTSCTSQASGFSLENEAGLAFGGNAITGLGTNGHAASAAETTAIAIGDDASTGAGATGAVAIGRGASVTATGARGSVALGEGSSATGANLSVPAYAVGGTADAEVNVGTRRITDVAAGAADGDAVNVAQLRAVNTAVTSAALLYDPAVTGYNAVRGGAAQRVTGVAAGTLGAASTDAVNGSQLAATNGNVTANGTAITNVSNGLSALDAVALRYDDAGHGTATLDGTFGTRIGNVAAGVGDGDAVNVAQLNGVAESVDALADDALLYDGVSGTYRATRAGISQRITGVANGTVAAGSTDAVNGGQLAATNANVTSNTTAITNVGDSLAALDAVALRYDDAGHGTVTLDGISGTRIGNVAAGAADGDAVNVAQLNALADDLGGLSGDALQYDAVAGAYNAARGGVRQRIAGIADGAVVADSSDAVTGGQLFATRQALDANATNITAVDARVTTVADDIDAGRVGPVRYSTSVSPTVSSGAGPSQDLTLVGAAPGSVALHNVAAGILGAGSNDAVNGGQLFSVGSSVAAALGGSSAFDGSTGAVTANLAFRGDSYGDVQGVVSAIETALGDSSGGGGPTTTARYFNSNSVAADSQAMGTDATAIGPNAIAAADGSIAAGRDTMAASEGSVAIGDGAQAVSGKSVSIGAQNIASGDGAVSIGDPNVATGDGAVALGRDNQATGTGTVALGDTNIITGSAAVGIGGQNRVNGTASVTLGYANVIDGDTSLALGSSNQLSGSRSIALGANNVVNGDDALAIGSDVTAGATDSLAIGNNSSARGTASIALGSRSSANTINATALGVDAVVSGDYGVALGQSALASGVASTAIGRASFASGDGSVAIGSGAQAPAAGSIALGTLANAARGAQANYAAFGTGTPQTSQGELAIAVSVPTLDLNGNPVALGPRQLTGLAAGSADTDAVNVAQLRGVSSTLGSALASSFGGGSAYDPAAGTISAPLYAVNGATYSNVGDAIAAITGVVSTVANTSVTYDGAARDRVTLGGASGTTIANVAAGTLSATSSEAVNGAQLFATNQQVNANTTAITQINNNLTGSTVVALQYSDPDAPTVSNGGTLTNDVTLVGANAATAVTLHNVAAGRIVAGSTDAVNGGQVAGIADAASNSVQYDRTAAGGRADTLTLAGGTVGAPVTLRNVAPGTSATDAVNLGQLSNGLGQAITASTDYTDAQVGELRSDLKGIRRDGSGGTAAAMALTSIPQAYGPGMGMVGFGVGTWGGERAIAIGASKASADGGFMLKAGASYNTRGDGGASVGAGFAF